MRRTPNRIHALFLLGALGPLLVSLALDLEGEPEPDAATDEPARGGTKDRPRDAAAPGP